MKVKGLRIEPISFLRGRKNLDYYTVTTDYIDIDDRLLTYKLLIIDHEVDEPIVVLKNPDKGIHDKKNIDSLVLPDLDDFTFDLSIVLTGVSTGKIVVKKIPVASVQGGALKKAPIIKIIEKQNNTVGNNHII